MGHGIFWIIVGIVVIIINASSETSNLVIKGTDIDYGYLAIILGLIFFFVGAAKKSGQKEEVETLKNALETSYEETKHKLINGSQASDVVTWLEKEIPKEIGVEYVKEIANEIKVEGRA
jgi:hypothetical protein